MGWGDREPNHKSKYLQLPSHPIDLRCSGPTRPPAQLMLFPCSLGQLVNSYSTLKIQLPCPIPTMAGSPFLPASWHTQCSPPPPRQLVPHFFLHHGTPGAALGWMADVDGSPPGGLLEGKGRPGHLCVPRPGAESTSLTHGERHAPQHTASLHPPDTLPRRRAVISPTRGTETQVGGGQSWDSNQSD